MHTGSFIELNHTIMSKERGLEPHNFALLEPHNLALPDPHNFAFLEPDLEPHENDVTDGTIQSMFQTRTGATS
jgi:hypothetical protein